MNRFEPLSSLILAVLAGAKKPITRYEVMTLVNHAVAFINHPYSPGAVYHQIKILEGLNMIKFNHKNPEITDLGRLEVKQRLLTSAKPESVFETVSHLLCLSLVNDPNIRKEGLKRLKVEMIKNGQNGPVNRFSDPELSAFNSAINDCRSELNKAVGRSILNMGA